MSRYMCGAWLTHLCWISIYWVTTCYWNNLSIHSDYVKCMAHTSIYVEYLYWVTTCQWNNLSIYSDYVKGHYLIIHVDDVYTYARVSVVIILNNHAYIFIVILSIRTLYVHWQRQQSCNDYDNNWKLFLALIYNWDRVQSLFCIIINS